MTLSEAIRAVESAKRMQKAKAQETASFHYILADLIGRSVARIHSSSNTMPSLHEVYPSLFDSEEMQEQRQKKTDELSVLRFKLFAQSFNDRFTGGVKGE